MKKNKIILVLNKSNSIFNFRKDLIEDMKRDNFEVIILAPDFNVYTYNYLKKLRLRGVIFRLSRTGINPINELLSILSLMTAIRKEKPDVVFCFQIKPAIYGSIAAIINRISNIFIMIEGLGYVFTVDNLMNILLKKILRILFKVAFIRTRKVFFLNAEDEFDFIKLKIIKPGKSIILGGIGVDLLDWSYSEPNTSEVSFIFIGRWLREKGIIDFLEAAKIIKSIYPETKFYVLGEIDSNPGSISKKYISYYIEKGIVECPGFVDVKPWLQKSSVFVLPSYYREGVPRSAQEALAIGRAVITTDSVGCRETVVDGRNGFLVPPKNPIAIAEAMEKLIKNKELIRKMGFESRRLAEAKFDVKEKNQVIIREIKKHLIV